MKLKGYDLPQDGMLLLDLLRQLLQLELAIRRRPLPEGAAAFRGSAGTARRPGRSCTGRGMAMPAFLVPSYLSLRFA